MPSRSILIQQLTKSLVSWLAQDTVAGNTALHLAAADGHLEVVKVLAKALSPEELGALNDRGINALMVTRTHDHSSRSDVRSCDLPVLVATGYLAELERPHAPLA